MKASERHHLFPPVIEPEWPTEYFLLLIVYIRDCALSKTQLNELKSQLEQYFYMAAYCHVIHEKRNSISEHTLEEENEEGGNLPPREKTIWQIDLEHMHKITQKNPESIYHGIHKIHMTPDIISLNERAVMSVEMYVELEATGFKIAKDLVKEKKPKQFTFHPRYTASEDDMLLRGTLIFGFDDLKSIQAHCL